MQPRNRSLIIPGGWQPSAGVAPPHWSGGGEPVLAASPHGASDEEPVLAAPPPVVGSQFILPYPVQLTVSKKINCTVDCDLTVSDVNGVVIFKIREEVFTLRNRCVLIDGVGNPLVTMKRKLWSAHDRWRVFRGDSSDEDDYLFAVIKKTSFTGLRVRFDVFLAQKEESPDFRIKGNYFDRNCTIYVGSSNGSFIHIMAEITRQHTACEATRGKDAFGVTVHPNFDYAFVIALVVILDGMHRGDEKDDD